MKLFSMMDEEYDAVSSVVLFHFEPRQILRLPPLDCAAPHSQGSSTTQTPHKHQSLPPTQSDSNPHVEPRPA